MDDPSSMLFAPRRAWRSLCLTLDLRRCGDLRTTRYALTKLDDVKRRPTSPHVFTTPDATPRLSKRRRDDRESPNLNVFRRMHTLPEGAVDGQPRGLNADRVKAPTDPFALARLGSRGGFLMDKTDRLTTTARSIQQVGFRGLIYTVARQPGRFKTCPAR